MARPSKDHESATESYEPSPCSDFDTSAAKINGNVPAKSGNESPTPATNDTKYNHVPAEPSYPEPSRWVVEHAQCTDYPAAAATEAEASKDPNGKGEN